MRLFFRGVGPQKPNSEKDKMTNGENYLTIQDLASVMRSFPGFVEAEYEELVQRRPTPKKISMLASLGLGIFDRGSLKYLKRERENPSIGTSLCCEGILLEFSYFSDDTVRNISVSDGYEDETPYPDMEEDPRYYGVATRIAQDNGVLLYSGFVQEDLTTALEVKSAIQNVRTASEQLCNVVKAEEERLYGLRKV